MLSLAKITYGWLARLPTAKLACVQLRGAQRVHKRVNNFLRAILFGAHCHLEMLTASTASNLIRIQSMVASFHFTNRSAPLLPWPLLAKAYRGLQCHNRPGATTGLLESSGCRRVDSTWCCVRPTAHGQLRDRSIDLRQSAEVNKSLHDLACHSHPVAA